MIIRQERCEKISFLGISGKGDTHQKNGKPNQDAIGFNMFEDSFVIAVSDGLGSCNNAHIGAQTAVALCNKIFMEIEDGQLRFRPEDIVKRLSNLWDETFPKIVSKDYSTTLKSAFLKNNEIITVSIGDGLLFTCVNNSVNDLKNTEDAYVNETACLSHGIRPDAFKTACIEKAETVFLCICTDGVSSVISEGRELEFFNELKKAESIHNLDSEIENMLIEMSKYNSDDKTIALVRYER